MLRKPAIILSVLWALAGPANAQECGVRANVLAMLADQYGESRRVAGLAPDGSAVEVFASEATGTWTITVTLPDGQTCLVASGDHYRALADAPVRPGQDT